MFTRRKLGTVYTRSPAQKIGKWLIDNLSKLILSLLAGAIWLVVFFVITGIIRFLGVKIGEWEDWEELTALQLYLQPKFFWTNVVGFFIVIFLVLRDRLHKR